MHLNSKSHSIYYLLYLCFCIARISRLENGYHVSACNKKRIDLHFNLCLVQFLSWMHCYWTLKQSWQKKMQVLHSIVCAVCCTWCVRRRHAVLVHVADHTRTPVRNSPCEVVSLSDTTHAGTPQWARPPPSQEPTLYFNHDCLLPFTTSQPPPPPPLLSPYKKGNSHMFVL